MVAPTMRQLAVVLALGLMSLALILWALAAYPTVLSGGRSCPIPDADGHIPQAAWDAGCRP